MMTGCSWVAVAMDAFLVAMMVLATITIGSLVICVVKDIWEAILEDKEV